MNQEFIQKIKQAKTVKMFVLWAMRMFGPIITLPYKISKVLSKYPSFFKNWFYFKKLNGKANFFNLYPCMEDAVHTTPFDTHYFYQAIWAFRHIFNLKPSEHVDVGSQLNFVGMLTTICKVVFVDIRPVEITLPNYVCKPGSITQLPFSDNSVSSISCLHVLEHIGLGRYGDQIDPLGHIKGAKELQRILVPSGQLYLSVPIGRSNVFFNAHRVFEISEILEMFSKCTLKEFAFVDFRGRFYDKASITDFSTQEESTSGNDFALGMFLFQKN